MPTQNPQKITLVTVLPIILLLIASNSFAFKDVGLPLIHVFTQDDYSAHNQNWDIIQADNHLIYVANGNGLLEYDGEHWRLYATPNRSRIREMRRVADKIYVGTTNDLGYFQSKENGELVYHSLLSKIDKKFQSFGDVLSVVKLQDFILFKTINYLFIYDGKSIKTVADDSHSRGKLIEFKQQVYFKLSNDEVVYLIDVHANNPLQASHWLLPKEAEIKKILLDKNEKATVFTAKNGIFQQENGKLVPINSTPLNTAFIYDVIKSADGYYYLATINQGLYVLSPELKVVKNYRESHGLYMNAIISIFEDFQNNIWIAGNKAIAVMRPPNAISTYAKEDNVYGHKLKFTLDQLTFYGSAIMQLQTDSENPLFPPRFKVVKNANLEVWDSISQQHGNSFFATRLGVELGRFENGQLQHQLISENKAFNYAIAATKNFKHLFVASDKGLNHVWQDDRGMWLTQLVVESEVNSLAIEDDKVLWVGTSSPLLYRLPIDSIVQGKKDVRKFTDKDGIGNNKIVPFATKALGLVFVTNDGVMQYQEADHALHFVPEVPEIFHTPKEDAHLLYDDLDGRLWYRIGSHSGFVEKINQQWQLHESLFKYFPDRSIDSFASNKENILWFQQADDGVYRVDVKRAQNIPAIAPLHVRKINNLSSQDTLAMGVLHSIKENIPAKNNSIRIAYALADYAILGKTQYRTRLLGSTQPQWSHWSKETYKDFTELKGASYRFEVQGRDGFGRLTDVTSLAFNVSPPFYLSTFAFFLYALISLILFAIFAWWLQKWRTKKLQAHNIHLAELVKLKTIEIEGHVLELQQQQELKTRFFTNVSHELRTPLSLILLPLKKLLQLNPNFNDENKALLSMSIKHADNLKQLVNEVLDISRFEQKQMPLVPVKHNLSSFVKKITHKFIALAAENRQDIVFTSHADNPEVYFDSQMMEKIISNLLSNAVKYSGQNATITVSILKSKQTAGFSIKDNGIGIAKEQAALVFERYFRAQSSPAQDSSGIGLSFVKEMVELHHGSIELLSDTEQGCEFICQFSLGKQHFTALKPQSLSHPIVLPKSEGQDLPADTPVIMSVEDNNDLRHFVAQALAINFKVIEAINGKDALDTLAHEIPDLIISDIMMPIMDGIELLQKVKEIEQFKSTPFILLTSKATQADTQLGLQYGADDYLSKPFEMDELLLRAKNIIAKRRLIQQQVKDQLRQIQEDLEPKRNSFEQKLHATVLAHLSDSHFNVNSLAQAVGMERTSLYRKVKKELHLSPTVYIQKVRLEIAKKLLQKEQINVSEAAYATGFESLSYFAKKFKTEFGHLPSEMFD